ncbi:MAG TPA: cytochrome c-type biogenesis protein [Rhizomicrobium sp.]|jgi:cytochrome c-type biogenesis protein CcmH|nr:cytochrome c-type biogenesis protein [Rhizomicrobium sp.]
MTRALALALLLMTAGVAAAQVEPPPSAVGETFSNPALESRARHLQRQLRCLVCQGESIDESNSTFAADLRRLVREQIAAGKSDQEVQDFLLARYGDFILLKPPLRPYTWLLWLAPFLVLVGAGGVAWITIKKAAAREG